jgi:hypothetical protein
VLKYQRITSLALCLILYCRRMAVSTSVFIFASSKEGRGIKKKSKIKDA